MPLKWWGATAVSAAVLAGVVAYRVVLVQAFPRVWAAHTREALEQGLTATLETITAGDAYRWFTHCGYRASFN